MIKLLVTLLLCSWNYSPEARSSDKTEKKFKEVNISSKNKNKDKNKSKNKDKNNSGNSKDTSGRTIIQKSRLFKCGDMEGVDEYCRKYLYRIPSVLITKNDTILAFASRRLENLREKGHVIRDWHHETENVVRRSKDKGATWSDDIVIAGGPGTNLDIHRGPVIYDKQNNKIYSFMRYGPARKGTFKDFKHPHEYSEMQTLQKMKQDKIGSSYMGDYVSYSSDHGKTWSKPKSIILPYPEGAKGAGVANGSHGIQLSNGRFVIQARYKLENKQKRVLFFSDKTNDLHKGKSWEHGAVISVVGYRMNEASEEEEGKVNMSKQEFTIAESPKNVVIANFRTGNKTGEGRVQVRVDNADSLGERARHIKALHAPNAHASILRGSKDFKKYYFSVVASAYDPDDDSESKALSRKGLYLYTSNDGAKTWQNSVIHKRDRYTGYSDMGLFSDGTIGLLYEAGKKVNYQFMIFKHLKLN